MTEDEPPRIEPIGVAPASIEPGAGPPAPLTLPTVGSQPYLGGPLADAASVLVFAGLGVLLADLFLLPWIARAPLALGVTLLGPLGCGIERGHARQATWPAALGLGALAAAAHGGGLLLLAALDAGDPSPILAASGWAPGELAIRLLVLLLGGALLARLGSRLDRGEAGWRAAVREGPPHGATALADRIGALRPTGAWRWLFLPLLPLSLLGRGAALLAILGYQLTLSRLMPPSCRYEPTCSRYGFEAFRRHGVLRGALLTAWRLVRCSPIGAGGFDPVPPFGAAAQAGGGPHAFGHDHEREGAQGPARCC